MTEPRKFLCEYPLDGAMWSIEVTADSFEEAEQRLRAMAFGRVLGIVEARIPAVAGAGWWARLLCWWRNRNA